MERNQKNAEHKREHYWEWLCSIPGLYYPLRMLLLEQFGSPEDVYGASEKALRRFAESVSSMSGAGNVIAQLIKLRLADVLVNALRYGILPPTGLEEHLENLVFFHNRKCLVNNRTRCNT